MNNDRIIYKCLSSAAAAVIFLYLCAVSVLKPVISHLTGSVNVPSMVFSIIFFLLVFLAQRNIQWKIPGAVPPAVFILSGGFLLASYSLERYENIHYDSIEAKIPYAVFCPAVILISFAVCFLISRYTNSVHKDKLLNIAGKASKISAVILLCVSLFNQLYIDYLDYIDYHHMHAFFNMISNLFWGQPYSETVNGIYGHYPFFYYPALKILYHFGFHNIYKAVIIISCILTICVLLIWLRILTWNVRNNFILLTAIFAICHVNASRIVHLFHQIYPHRTLPIAVTAFEIALWYRQTGKNRTKLSVIGYVVNTLLIIWNTEFGLVAIAAWSALHICSALQSDLKKNIGKILLHLAVIPVSFFSAVLISGLMNTLLGGGMISISSFVFPIFSDELMHETEYPLPAFPSAWMSIMILFLCFLGYGLKDTVLFTKNYRKNDRSAVCFSAAVLGLGCMTYPMSRPAYKEYYILLPLCGLLIAIMADSFSKQMADLFQKDPAGSAAQKFNGMIGLLSFLVLIFLMINTILNIPNKMSDVKSHMRSDNIKEICTWMVGLDGKKAYAVGKTANLTYAYLGWDPGIYYLDISNLAYSMEAYDSLFDQMKNMENDACFVSDYVYNDLPDEFLSTHKMISIIEVKDTKLRYYVPAAQ